jgi:Domain of unknown function (DUF4349)
MRLTDDQIGAELTALRETPETDFAAKLDRRVAAGFPSERTVEQKRELTWGRLLPALGTLAAVAVVAVVISNSGGGGGSDSATPTSAPATSQFGKGAVRSEQIVPSPTTQVPPTTGRPRNGQPQVQERTAQLGLATDADKLQDAADGVVDVTGRYDGFVDSSNVHTGGSRGRASFELRIPTQHLQDALSDLSDLGRVTLLNQGSTNVTGSYVDAGKAYADARANVDDLTEQLRDASSPSEAEAIRAQLDVARQQLAAARAALRSLKQRVAYTPVSVEITAQGDGSWSIGDAADDAVGVLEAIGGATLIALAVLIPLGALLVLGWLGTRELRRRRREAALD